ncbi:MAG: hypothetical protein ACRD0A_10405 [Acidimicrobiales bacterium]
MTTAVRAPARIGPARGPQPGLPRPRPRLAVVRQATRSRSAPSARLIVIGGIVLFLLLFALAGFQAVLVSSQERLDELDRQVAVAQDRYHDLRVEVAALEAPDRILNTAIHELGMVPSGPATYLTPSDAVAAEVAANAAEAEVEAADGPAPSDVNDVANDAATPGDSSASSWPEVKPYLEPSP